MMLAIGAALALLGAGCSGGSPASNQDSQQAVVNYFMSAVQSKDKDNAKAVVDTESEFYTEFDEAWDELSSLTVKSYTVGEVDGNEVEVEITIEEDGETDTDGETFDLVEKDGKWWIVEP